MIHTVVIASESTKGNPIPLLPNNISISNRKLATRKTAPTAKRTAWPDVCVPCLESNLRPSDSTRRKQTLWKRGRIRQRRFVPQVPPNPRITPPKLTSLTWRKRESVSRLSVRFSVCPRTGEWKQRRNTLHTTSVLRLCVASAREYICWWRLHHHSLHHALRKYHW